MEESQKLTGPGKTAPRLILDLLDHDTRNPSASGRNLLAKPAPRWKPGMAVVRRGPLDCHHSLMRKASQSYQPTSNDQIYDDTDKWTVAAYCVHCSCHITIVADYHGSKRPCHLSDENNPLHHFLRASYESGPQYTARLAENGEVDEFDTPVEIHQFDCSGELCNLCVDIRIIPPRLTPAMCSLLLDPAKVMARGKREIEDDPDRYAGLSPVRPLQALNFLRTYIKDAKHSSETSPENLRQIAKRNKKYMLAFGNDCDELFKALYFTPHEERPDPDGEISYFWRPPLIAGKNKNFFEDVLLELEIKMLGRPNSEQHAGNTLINLRPLPALKDIERSLGCFDYPTKSRTVDLETPEHPYYASLGAVDNFTDELLSWAYDRQCQTNPKFKPYYLDCLIDLAQGRKSSDLDTKVAMAISAGEYGQKAIDGAYTYFGLHPNSKEEDDHIMGLYRSRIESAPKHKEDAKAQLLILAKARSSSKIEALANDNTMTLQEALELLGVPEGTPPDMIVASAVATAMDTNKAKVARALRVIATHRPSYILDMAAYQMDGTGEGGEPALDVGEAYNRLQITTRSAPDSTIFEYYKSLSGGAAPGSKESFTQALRAIAHDRQSHFLLRKLNDPNAVVTPEETDLSQPVGLNNIGNTCYLNSLLQYFYTIRAVRDVAMNIDEYQMPLTGDELENRRAGGRKVTRSEVEKGQLFVKELRDLFQNLQTAPTRSIRPTVELAELSFFSEAVNESIRRQSIASPHGPPNIASIMDGPMYGPVYGPEGPPPPMPSRPTPETIDEDIEMEDESADKNTGNVSETSEQTLVDGDSLPAYDNVEAEKGSSMHVETREISQDTVMINGDVSSTLTSYPPPDKPPPVPPRNKSGLSIKTAGEQKLIPNDERWRLGTQQDVDEVIRNTTFRMMCAIKPIITDPESGDQTDKIRDTFYGDNATYLEKATKLERKVESWSSLLVYPSKTKAIDIYEALDSVFDMQQVTVDKTTVPQYASIDKLPPVLQIQINRTDFDPIKQMPVKVKSAVVFQETLFLDRYMDSKDPESALMRRRRQAWGWKAELRDLEARLDVLQNGEALPLKPVAGAFPANRENGDSKGPEMNVKDALLATKDYVQWLQEEEIEEIDIDDFLSDLLEERIEEVGTELENIRERIARLKNMLAEQFTDMRQYSYKLQAVFIHRGTAGAGHYWIYIYDFKNDVWREYNDETVTIVTDRNRIFDSQGDEATPYYLVYVRGTDREELVDPICRDVQIVAQEGPVDVMSDWQTVNVEENGNSMEDLDETRHIEHAKPRALRPKVPLGEWEKVADQKEQAVDDGLDANGRPW